VRLPFWILAPGSWILLQRTHAVACCFSAS
jgi:hypothetical protein